jgi:hypothetical protein
MRIREDHYQEVIRQEELAKSVQVCSGQHDFSYIDKRGVKHVLIKGFDLSDVEVSHAEVVKIKGAYGVSEGYMLVFGKGENAGELMVL